ncbi:hypothetical protein EYC80_003033 [Monilinia laxa]|uniref:Uncharacterized protein n=1 Tax=Monilinia laxa TaxID=61186 RepID=A0A5N6KDR1_MONLA|nr:hypothetical protein EYC80_003033 [Monilinia laxa]
MVSIVLSVDSSLGTVDLKAETSCKSMSTGLTQGSSMDGSRESRHLIENGSWNLEALIAWIAQQFGLLGRYGYGWYGGYGMI